MVLKVCTTEYSVLERMMKAYINFPLKKILQIKHVKKIVLSHLKRKALKDPFPAQFQPLPILVHQSFST